MNSAGAAGGPGRRGGSSSEVDVDRRAGFEAVFLDPFGREVQQRWADAALAVAFEDLDPVSAFPVPPGRRWGPGLWWSGMAGRHVVAGSNAMRAQLMVLDRDPQVTGLAGRPVRLVWRDGRGMVRSWVPQLFARYADGTALLADCPSHMEAGGERAQRAGAAVAAACEEVGWRYRRLEPLEPVLGANLRWLAGYRHPRNQGRPGLMAAVLQAFAAPRPMIEGVEAVGDPVEVMPVVLHALWRGDLTAPLDVPLHERVPVGPAGVPARHAGSGRGPGGGAGDESSVRGTDGSANSRRVEGEER
ncbi:TnsA-like heteromeric transposase endonuclease subunit [Kitasatospora sp. RB6PN24]|uniref:TnsA-like heteromeric transposase endonuclease subunit n=1 Tax=Kitasatospora humi TaxID=2893891 RepID=UPI001E64CAB5|nr:TnsA-like heteromeric transposase endonuclease subunit [Kitasatospora humi]MCC9312321.1 TnsA-like heteromeric transposase endonuclease subunit [Kitasatospora humi]